MITMYQMVTCKLIIMNLPRIITRLCRFTFSSLFSCSAHNFTVLFHRGRELIKKIHSSESTSVITIIVLKTMS